MRSESFLLSEYKLSKSDFIFVNYILKFIYVCLAGWC